MAKRTMAKRLGGIALCSVAVLMGASVAFGQVTRTVLQQTDVSIPGREVITARADIPAGSAAGLHTHPSDCARQATGRAQRIPRCPSWRSPRSA